MSFPFTFWCLAPLGRAIAHHHGRYPGADVDEEGPAGQRQEISEGFNNCPNGEKSHQERRQSKDLSVAELAMRFLEADDAFWHVLGACPLSRKERADPSRSNFKVNFLGNIGTYRHGHEYGMGGAACDLALLVQGWEIKLLIDPLVW